VQKGPGKQRAGSLSRLEIPHGGETHRALKVSCKRQEDEIFLFAASDDGQEPARSPVSGLSGWTISSRNVLLGLTRGLSHPRPAARSGVPSRGWQLGTAAADHPPPLAAPARDNFITSPRVSSEVAQPRDCRGIFSCKSVCKWQAPGAAEMFRFHLSPRGGIN